MSTPKLSQRKLFTFPDIPGFIKRIFQSKKAEQKKEDGWEPVAESVNGANILMKKPAPKPEPLKAPEPIADDQNDAPQETPVDKPKNQKPTQLKPRHDKPSK